MSNPFTRLAVILLLLASLTSCGLGPKEYGVLEGRVTIGPLVPAVQVGDSDPTPAPEVYAAREIVVYKQNGKTEFARLVIDPTGFYQAELPVGTYVIDINRLGIDSADNLPLEITITPNQKTTLDMTPSQSHQLQSPSRNTLLQRPMLQSRGVALWSPELFGLIL